MKVKRTIVKEIKVNIKGITLLSIEEAENLPVHLRHYSSWWWLRSPGETNYYTAIVGIGGTVFDIGDDIDCYSPVRPALIYNSKHLEIGDIIIFGDKEWEVVDERYAFCTTDIGRHRFDEESNNYDISEIKQYVENWLEKAKQEVEE